MDCFAGKYLVEEIFKRDDVELAFVWNRTSSVLNGHVDPQYILEDLKDFEGRLAYLANLTITHISQASFLWDVGNQYRFRSGAAEAASDQGLHLGKNQKCNPATLQTEIDIVSISLIIYLTAVHYNLLLTYNLLWTLR